MLAERTVLSWQAILPALARHAKQAMCRRCLTATPKNLMPELPDPSERPEADVVVYDGHCGICTSQVRKLRWWDRSGRLAYLSLHDEEVTRRWPDLSRERLDEEMCIVDRRGNRHWGPEAVRYLTSRLPGLWWAAPVLYFPGSMLLWRPLYRWIARNRYRFSSQSCDTGGCKR